MKKLTKITLISALMLISGFVFAQSTVTGSVNDADMNAPLPGANVVEKGTTNGTTTDFDGNFSLTTSSDSGEIIISYVGYGSKTIAFNGNTNVGGVSLASDNSLQEVVLIGTGVVDLAEDRKTPVAVSTVRAAEIQARVTGNVEFAEVLKNTPSVYVSNQAGGFGDGQMFTRGFSQSNTAFLLNGQPINGMEDGKMYWSNWSGMSDVANAVQIQRGLGSSKLAISSVGGTINIVSKTTDQAQGGYIRMLGGNDSYFKTTASYNTGVNDKGWAFSFLLDHWQGHRKYAEGTAGQGQNYFFSVGYKASDRSAFNFLITGAPQWHDQNFSKSLESYDEFGIKHNPNSGWYNGERFTERRNYYHKPVANLNWDYNLNDSMDLSTVLYASWGRGGGTGGYGRGRQRYEDDPSYNGESPYLIDFNAIERENIANADANGNGNFGDSYVRRSSVNNHNWYGLVSNLNIDNGGPVTFNVGVDGRTYTGDHFRQVADWFGLNGWADTYGTTRPSDYVITNNYDANPWSALFDFADEGDRIAYDYSETINYLGGFGQAEYATDKFSAFLQGSFSTQSYQRTGGEVWSGAGESEKINKTGYNIKGGLGYNLDSKSSFFFNAGLYSRQPFLDNIFANVRSSNDLFEGGEVDNEEIIGFEGGYRFKNDVVRLNIDLYSTEWGNRFIAASGGPILNPDGSESGEFQTYRFNDVTQIHNGIEYDLQYRPRASSVAFSSFGSIGNWKYADSTPYTLRNDETNELIDSGTLDLSDIKVGQAPQTSFGFGLDWDVLENLSVDANWNIYGSFYGFVDVEDVIDAGLDGVDYQSERLDAYDLVDFGLTYKFMLGSEQIVFRGNVFNLFDETYINQKDAYGYFYGNGRTWNVSFRYNF